MGDVINTVAVVLQILSALGVILLVLLQHGKGADMGAAFGSGASGSLFGATGSANFLSRLTAAMAAVFFVSTLALAFFANDRPGAGGSLMEGVTTPPSSVPTLPGAPSGSSVPPASTVPPSPGSSSAPSGGAQSGPQSGANPGAQSGAQPGGPGGAQSGGSVPAGDGSGAASQIPK
jgi:preprotein translocase subunit SecG